MSTITRSLSELNKSVGSDGEFIGKNACTAWINFDGSSSSTTIRDSYNISSILEISQGKFELTFSTVMDNVNYSIAGMHNVMAGASADVYIIAMATNKVTIQLNNGDGVTNATLATLIVLGGKD